VKTWRSWPWTIALGAVLGAFVLLGVVGLGLRTSGVEVAVSLLVTGAAFVGLMRVLSMGVKGTPTGLVIRDLTRTTMVPWTDVRKVTVAQTDRRGVHAPVLRMSGARAAGSGRRGAGTGERQDIEVTVLGSYRPVVAQRRADELELARKDATRRTR
jgi:hypothetical protein